MKRKKNLLLLLIVFGSLPFLTSCSKNDNTVPPSNETAILPTKRDTVAFITPSTEEAQFDNIHYALGSLVYGGSGIATNGQSVGTIPDLKGNLNLTYRGNPKPTITGAPPALIDNRWIAFDNRPETQYETNEFAAVKPPFEMWYVFRYMPGQRYEGMFPGGHNAGYVGDNSGGMRIINSSYGFVPNSSMPANYQTNLCRLVVRADNSADYYQNGTLVGNVKFQSADINGVIKTVIGLGVNTNSADFDFAAMYFKKGTFTNDDATTIYNSIAKKWSVLSIPNQILLSKIRWDNDKGTYTPSATVINVPTGVTLADPSTWDYEWYWKSDQTNFNPQTMFSTKRVITKADFPANDATHSNVSIKFRVRPKDTNGKYWRYFSGTFGPYINGSQE